MSASCPGSPFDPRPDFVFGDGRILAIAAPALASLCLDPLMSAADTVVVGQLASTSELGGLAVATTVITVSFCDFNFLSTSTAPFVASARAGGDAEGASKLAGTAMTSACIIGLALAAGLYLFAAPVATIVAGPGGDAGVLAAAEGIVRIRALAAPAALLVSASNGAFRRENAPLLPRGRPSLSLSNCFPLCILWVGGGVGKGFSFLSATLHLMSTLGCAGAC